MPYRIGVDIGGTFTDFALIDDATGDMSIHKQLTTPKDPSHAVLEGIDTLLDARGVPMSSVSTVIHGSTLVTNALIERRGARIFVGPGDLSQSMGYPPHVPAGRRRARDVLDLVDTTLHRIRAAGKVAGTLAVKQDAAHLVAQGAQLIYYHADPFLVDGVNAMRELVSHPRAEIRPAVDAA